MIKIPVKIGVLFLKKEKEEILDFLQKNGSLHIIETKKEKDKREELIDIETKIAKIKFVLNFLSLFEEKEKKGLKDKIQEVLVGERICLREKEIKERMERFNLNEIVRICETIEGNLAQIEKLQKELKEKKEFFEKWKNLPYDLEQISKIESLRVFCGTIKNIELFERELSKKTNLYELKAIEQNKKEGKICLLYHPSKEKEIKELLKKFGAIEEKEIENSPLVKKELEKIEKEEKRILKNKEFLLKKINEIKKDYGQDLKIAFDYFNWKKRKTEVELQLLKGDLMMLAVGWIEAGKIKELKEGLAKITKNFEILKLKLEKGEEPPIILRPQKIFSPGTPLLEIYGYPGPKDTDPLPFMLPFFVLFFGFCLGDLGYGILMTLFSLFLIKLLKRNHGLKTPLYLLLYCGISTIIMGILFGSFFGIEIQKIQLISLAKSPLLGLFLSLVLGIIQIICALAIKMYVKIKNNLKKEAFLDEFLWILFFINLLVFCAKDLLNLPEKIAKYLLFIPLFLIVLSNTRKTKNILLKPFVGIISLQDSIGYFSDILSYSRLLALGLATSIIAFVVNLTSQIIKDMIPLLGILISVLILIGGHLFNFVISSLGAFIHSMRLQFVEFVPKFMQGGGKKFIPFCRETKYLEFSNLAN